MASLDSFKCRRTLTVGAKTYEIYSLKSAEKNGLAGISQLPFSLKIVLENLLRNEDGRTVTKEDIEAVAAWTENRGKTEHEIAFRPARVLMQDFTGVPAVVDLAAMRDAMAALGGDPDKINPLVPVDLVIDHSVVVDHFGTPSAFAQNVDARIRAQPGALPLPQWGQQAFANFRSCRPAPASAIRSTSNISRRPSGRRRRSATARRSRSPIPTRSSAPIATPPWSTASRVLGWGVGGIEAEAAMLGQPLSMLLPEVIGFRCIGELREGVTATDLVLTVTQMLRKKGVVGKFVEFYGPGLNAMTVADRATIANMAPEYGATCGLFPIDAQTLSYLTSYRPQALAHRPGRGLRQGAGTLSHPASRPTRSSPTRSSSTSARSRPRSPAPSGRRTGSSLDRGQGGLRPGDGDRVQAGAMRSRRGTTVEGTNYDLGNGDVVIAAITSCTNTSNPSVMIAAGLVARNAVATGLTVKPWVKTSLAPGSQVVHGLSQGGRPAAAARQARLQHRRLRLHDLHRQFAARSRPRFPATIAKHDLVAAAVLSGNRNFEGRVNPDVRANYLASPPLVVAYALAGSMQVDLTRDPLGKDKQGKDVYLADIWPKTDEVQNLVDSTITAKMFKTKYASVFDGDPNWRKVKVPAGLTYAWDMGSTYVQNPPYFEGLTKTPPPVTDIENARILALFLDSITTDHISPGRLDQGGEPGGRLSDRASGASGRLQPVRHPSRQPSGDDARHLRQHPHQEPDGEGRGRKRGRGRLHDSSALRRAHGDL